MAAEEVERVLELARGRGGCSAEEHNLSKELVNEGMQNQQSVLQSGFSHSTSIYM